MYKIPCTKCYGKGVLSHYRSVAGGTCFRCKGDGFFTTKDKKRYEEYLQSEEEKKRIRIKEKAKKQIIERSEQLEKDINFIITIAADKEDMKTDEGQYVYKRTKNKIKKALTTYKQYKTEYKEEIKEIENICKKYNINCV